MRLLYWIALLSLNGLPQNIAVVAVPSTPTLKFNSNSATSFATSRTPFDFVSKSSTGSGRVPAKRSHSVRNIASSTNSTGGFPTYHNSTTATSGTTNATQPSQQRLPGGAVAGIAIGCSTAAALIAAGVVFFIMKNTLRRGRHNNPELYSLAPKSSRPRIRKNGGIQSKDGRELEISAQEISVEHALEQPKDDGTIKQSVASLFKAIEDHVDNFYLDTSIKDIPELAQQKHRQLDLPTGIRSQTNIDFVALLSDPVSRSSAIVSLICAELLDALDFFGTPERSLLPEMITNFLNGTSARAQDNQRSRLYLSRWTTGTAYLLGATESAQDKEHRLKVTGAIVADLDTIIGPYCKPQLDNERRDHLLKLCKRAHDLGLLLLSQPAEWRFYWSYGKKARRPEHQSQRTERGRRESLVVQPQVCRLTDNMARLLDRPLVILERHVLH